MKKKILSQLMILSFAFAGLLLVGNNVFGGVGDLVDVPPAITCNRFPGHEHISWTWSQSELRCVWTGKQGDACIIL